MKKNLKETKQSLHSWTLKDLNPQLLCTCLLLKNLNSIKKNDLMKNIKQITNHK